MTGQRANLEAVAEDALRVSAPIPRLSRRKFTATTKYCSTCDTWLLLTDFNRHSGQPSGRQDRCRKCSSLKAKEWRLNNPEEALARNVRCRERNRNYYRDYSLRKKYSIGLAEKNAIINSQQGKCPICADQITDEGSHIDHCHETNLIRGVLCNTCNRGIGYLGDDVTTLQRAIAYLAAHR